MKKIIISICIFYLALFSIGCGEHQSHPVPKIEKVPRVDKSPVTGTPLKQIEWKTIGTLDTHFFIEPTDDGRFKFFRSEYWDSRPPFEGYFNQESDPDLFQTLVKIFSGEFTIQNTKCTLTDEVGYPIPGGECTSLTLTDLSGKQTTYQEPRIFTNDGAEVKIFDLWRKNDSFDPYRSWSWPPRQTEDSSPETALH